MAKITLAVDDALLAEIDAEAGGNRTGFMVAASLERARALHRERVDRELVAILDADADADMVVYRDWESTMADGLD